MTYTPTIKGSGLAGVARNGRGGERGRPGDLTPVMLVHFNQLSPSGILANLVVVPLAAAAAQPICFL